MRSIRKGTGGGPDAERALSREDDVALDTLCTGSCVTIMYRISARTKVDQFCARRPLDAFTGSLSNAIHILRACSGAFGNDCGLLHIAVALDLPTLAVFGPSEAAWFPYRQVETQSFLGAKRSVTAWLRP